MQHHPALMHILHTVIGNLIHGLVKNAKEKKIQDIADQLIHGETGKNFKVILGGGRSVFLDENIRGEEGDPGVRKDGKNLIKEWLDARGNDGSNAKYIWCRKNLMDLNVNETDYLLGLFNPDHMPYNGDRYRYLTNEADPSLSEMTKTALEMLKKKFKWFLFIS